MYSVVQVDKRMFRDVDKGSIWCLQSKTTAAHNLLDKSFMTKSDIWKMSRCTWKQLSFVNRSSVRRGSVCVYCSCNCSCDDDDFSLLLLSDTTFPLVMKSKI